MLACFSLATGDNRVKLFKVLSKQGATRNYNTFLLEKKNGTLLFNLIYFGVPIDT